MPENVMLNHNYVMAEGGTGVRALLAAHMYLSAKAYAAGENGRTENWKFIYETMDAGAEEIEQLQKLVRLDSESEFCAELIQYAAGIPTNQILPTIQIRAIATIRMVRMADVVKYFLL